METKTEELEHEFGSWQKRNKVNVNLLSVVGRHTKTKIPRLDD